MFDAQKEACVAAAQAGAKVLLQYFRRLDPATITEKTKNDVVSDADRGAEAAIRAELAFRFPQYGFLGEEGGSHGSAEIRWIVDPLDGTLNFVQGFP
ncbi:MAG: inositol monophosphatase family protein, partial [Geothrix sp.]|nr:inositol monophosphatase family protein [Geothrix sp.]